MNTIDIRKSAEWAYISIPDDANYNEYILNMLELFDTLPEGVDNNEPDEIDIMQLREDVVVCQFTREEMLRNAPFQFEGYVEIPKVLDK